MRRILIAGLMLLSMACGAFAQGAQGSAPKGGDWLKGDYVEARTASVFAGACHFNGEVVTTGRDAVLAWNITGGSWRGTNMAGVRAIAVVSSQTNLSETGEGARLHEIIVDSAASEAQFAAIVEVFKEKFASTLGVARAVRRAPVSFRLEKETFLFDSPGFATLSVRAMPNALCCKMPNMVWYSPLVKLSNRKVGYTLTASYAGGALGDAWQRGGENSAFYGAFTL
jgi:hypothetical protein